MKASTGGAVVTQPAFDKMDRGGFGDRAGCARDAKVVLADSPGDTEAESLVATCTP